ncbi:L-threonine 3-dehydrogenase [Klebsiella variicola]|uniref:L-threonine 3-dehydrogenase n=1 Tax=Klebsiella variicola TaxID=244366 RepID=A0A7H4M9P2_KLEVA|nr:L-threonine 3-dehydrogenase [Klebsiella variicola]
MKALSKLKAEEGIWMTDVPEPEVGHNDLLIKIRKNRHLRNRRAHLQLG